MIFPIYEQKKVSIIDFELTVVELEYLISCVSNAAEKIKKTPSLESAAYYLMEMKDKIRDISPPNKNFQPS
jgi:hypothetical protein